MARVVVIFFALVTMACGLAAAAGPEILTAVQKCDARHLHCLLMEIDTPESGLPKGEELPNGETRFIVPVSGRLADGPNSLHRLSLTAYSDGLACDRFGQAKVAVRGLRNAHAVIETSRGPLEVTNEALEVGCKECLRLLDKRSGRTKAVYRSPSRDLALLDVSAVYADVNGVIWMQVGNSTQGRCVRLTQNGDYIAEQESYSCLRNGLHKLMGRESSAQHDGETFRRFDLEALPFYVDLLNRACS